MILSPELLLALASVVTAIVTVFSNQRAARVMARKDEMALLRDEVTRLQERVRLLECETDKYRRNETRLLDYVATLRTLMIESKIAVPPMPELE